MSKVGAFMINNDNEARTVFPIPYGTRDMLPQEAWRKRLLERGLADLFSRWGYREVVTPTLEYAATLEAGDAAAARERVFKFFDAANRVVVLRPDMTTPIARLVATRLRDETGPLRFFYLANVFRYEQPQAGRQCEFCQAGVELVGNGGAVADAEVVALAVAALRETGLDDFQISLGQVAFINGLIAASGLSPAAGEAVRQALLSRDLVGLESTLAQADLSPRQRKVLGHIPRWHGREEVLTEAAAAVDNTTSQAALANLQEVYRLLTAYGVADYVHFDLGLVRDLDYYTGLVFEGYTPGLGFPVCGGGRYDNLVGAFGANQPATGFALGLERVMLAQQRQGLAAPSLARDYYVAWAPGREERAIAAAAALRRQEHTVVLAPAPQDKTAAERARREQECRQLWYVE